MLCYSDWVSHDVGHLRWTRLYGLVRKSSMLFCFFRLRTSIRAWNGKINPKWTNGVKSCKDHYPLELTNLTAFKFSSDSSESLIFSRRMKSNLYKCFQFKYLDHSSGVTNFLSRVSNIRIKLHLWEKPIDNRLNHVRTSSPRPLYFLPSPQFRNYLCIRLEEHC